MLLLENTKAKGDSAMKVVITIEAEIDELEAECFNNNMTDEDLDGQADLVKDILRMGHFSRHGVNPTINWKVESNSPFNPWRLIGGK
jgi:hypothetical protein|tara:strand:+ start:1718 stop:1978 length:261 start_codon:yes stop_codon:yes gene_type:complete